MYRIVFVGGGSGGHVFPLFAIIKKFKQILADNGFDNSEFEVYYCAPDDFGFSRMEELGVVTIKIPSGKMRRYFSFLNLFDFFVLLWGIIKSAYVMWNIMPDLVVSKGGYGSFPIVLWSFLYRVPYIIHESDVVPGLVNRIFYRGASVFLSSFEKTKDFLPSTSYYAVTGNPVRDSVIIVKPTEELVQKARKFFKIDPASNRKTILVLGGSQGAKELNDLIFGVANKLLKDCYVIHQAGFGEKAARLREDFRLYYPKELAKFIRIYEFLDDEKLKMAYTVADLVVSRAGSGSIFEIANNAKPSILIPLKNSAGDHQKENAYEYAKTGASLVIEEPNINPGLFYNQVKQLLDDPNLLLKMSEKAAEFIKFDSSKFLAELILKILRINQNVQYIYD